MSFIFDEGDEGFLGYLASSQRIDSIRLIMEWLDRMIESLDLKELQRLLAELEKELSRQE